MMRSGREGKDVIKIDRSLAVLIAGVAVAALLAIAGTVLLVEIAGAEFLPARLLGGRRQATDSAIILATRPPATPTASEPARPTVTPEPPHLTPVATEREEQAPAEQAPQAGVVVPQEAPEPDPLDDVVALVTPELTSAPTESAPTTKAPDGPPVATPTDVATATPDQVDADTPVPTGTPDPTPSATPGEPIDPPAADLPPATSGAGFDDLADFADYLRARRTTVAGQPYEILALTMDEEPSTPRRFALTVAAGEGTDIFVEQTGEDLLTFGRDLLEDVKRYLGGAACEITVESTYAVTQTETCLAASGWCAVGAPEAADGAATITWTYLRGSHIDGVDTVEVWTPDAQGRP